MQTSNITMPDGRLISIAGADAPQVAAVLRNEFLSTPTAPQIIGSFPNTLAAMTHNEMPLEVPTMNFGPAQHSETVEQAETALALPSMV